MCVRARAAYQVSSRVHPRTVDSVKAALAEEYEKRTQPCNCEIPEEACEDPTDGEEGGEEDGEAAATDGEYVDEEEQRERKREREQLKPLIGYEKRVGELQSLQRCYDSAFQNLVDGAVRRSPKLTKKGMGSPGHVAIVLTQARRIRDTRSTVSTTHH